MAVEADAMSAMHEARRTIPQVIRRLSEHYHVTASGLAEVLGVTRTAITARLTEKTVIKSEELAALGHFFGVPALVFYLTPDEALRWVLDHPDRRPAWLTDQGKTLKSCWLESLPGSDYLTLPVPA